MNHCRRKKNRHVAVEGRNVSIARSLSRKDATAARRGDVGGATAGVDRFVLPCA